MAKPIQLKNLSLSFPHKTCFDGFSATIPFGSKIAIIGPNGSGKSTLLKALAGMSVLVEGEINLPPNCVVGYVPQTISEYPELSGGQRFNKCLSEELAKSPDILLLDEPTNHLDIYNRRSLLQMLERFGGTLIVASHDEELLRRQNCILWNIDQSRLDVFSGNYDDYKTKQNMARAALEQEHSCLDKQKREIHQKAMKEQQRASNSRQRGEKNKAAHKWAPIIAGGKKRQAQNTAGKKSADISQRQGDVNEQLRNLRIPDIIRPTFTLGAQSTSHTPVFISQGSAGYPNHPVLADINLALDASHKVALTGANASGKTTLLRAILQEPTVLTSGVWELPKPENIGYLDQHYNSLDPQQTVLSTLKNLVPGWTHAQLRKHLNDFLFRKNEEVNASVAVLSGGERARLSLAAIACRVPQLLILDEVTNNIDLQTKEHICEVLRDYPGAMLVVSHEPDFIRALDICTVYLVENGRLARVEPETL